MKEFVGKSKGGSYGDNVEEMDWSVGEVMKELENLKLLEDTLVIFSSGFLFYFIFFYLFNFFPKIMVLI
jgi:membrane-anchored protein YejM (alkaline phosphatase superfamily)